MEIFRTHLVQVLPESKQTLLHVSLHTPVVPECRRNLCISWLSKMFHPPWRWTSNANLRMWCIVGVLASWHLPLCLQRFSPSLVEPRIAADLVYFVAFALCKGSATHTLLSDRSIDTIPIYNYLKSVILYIGNVTQICSDGGLQWYQLVCAALKMDACLDAEMHC